MKPLLPSDHPPSGAGTRQTWLPWILRAGTGLLLPPRCNFCGRELAEAACQPLLCAECRDAFLVRTEAACPRCAAPVHPLEAGPDCPRCRPRRYAFQAALALGVYRDRLREAVIRMKQRIHEPLTLSMGHLMAQALADSIRQERPDYLAAVPTHWWKRLRRGVHSPDLLVEAIAASLSIRGSRRLLYSRRSTKKQGTLLPHERRRNVRHAFGVTKGYDLTGARVMLVDDIMTTGATASEAARVLRGAGAERVVVLVVARGVGLDQRRSL